MAGRPRTIPEVRANQKFGVLRTVSAEFYKRRQRVIGVQCTSCSKVWDMKVTDLTRGYQCKCQARGRKRGPRL